MQCGLLGRKLGHSYSPQIHRELGSYQYTLFEKEPQELEEFLKNGDEIIVSSSSNFCLHAASLNGAPVGGKDPATLKAIQDEVLREFYDYTGCSTLQG